MNCVRTNLEVNASGNYTNFNFVSFCNYEGTIIAVGPSGVFKLGEGDTDNGVAISAYFTIHKSDYGVDTKKRVRFLYASMESTGDVEFTIVGDGKTTMGPYAAVVDTNEDEQKRRVVFQVATPFSYGALTVANKDGSIFSIDEIQTYLYTLSHGRA